LEKDSKTQCKSSECVQYKKVLDFIEYVVDKSDDKEVSKLKQKITSIYSQLK